MDSVRSARARLSAYPAHLAACAPQGAAYAKCVASSMGEVTKDQCQAQFRLFKQCVAEQAKKAASKL